MRFRGLIPLLMLALSLVLLAGCAPGRGDIWVDRLEIVVREDQSGRVRFIVMEWQAAIDRQMQDGEEPELVQVRRDWVDPCGFTTQDYLANGDAPGFIATARFSDKEELEYALTCIPLLAQIAWLHPLSVDERPWGTRYELQLDLGYPEAFREVQITLPGRVSAQAALIPAGLSVETERVSPDTILYTISGSRPCRGLFCEEAAAEPTQELISSWPTAGSTPTATPSPQPTAPTPSATETSEDWLVLSARSFHPNLPVIGLLALLAVLIVGGPLVTGVRAGRRRARRVAAGMDAVQLEQFHDALLDAFRSYASLERMVRFELGENLEEIAGEGPLADVVYRLVEWADSEGRLADLLRGARTQNPGNERLHRLEKRTLRKTHDARTQDSSATGDDPS